MLVLRLPMADEEIINPVSRILGFNSKNDSFPRFNLDEGLSRFVGKAPEVESKNPENSALQQNCFPDLNTTADYQNILTMTKPTTSKSCGEDTSVTTVTGSLFSNTAVRTGKSGMSNSSCDLKVLPKADPTFSSWPTPHLSNPLINPALGQLLRDCYVAVDPQLLGCPSTSQMFFPTSDVLLQQVQNQLLKLQSIAAAAKDLSQLNQQCQLLEKINKVSLNDCRTRG